MENKTIEQRLQELESKNEELTNQIACIQTSKFKITGNGWTRLAWISHGVALICINVSGGSHRI